MYVSMHFDVLLNSLQCNVSEAVVLKQFLNLIKPNKYMLENLNGFVPFLT